MGVEEIATFLKDDDKEGYHDYDTVAVVLLIANTKGQIIGTVLVQENVSDTTKNAGTRSVPAGHIEENKTPVEAAVTEVQEETGLILSQNIIRDTQITVLFTLAEDDLEKVIKRTRVFYAVIAENERQNHVDKDACKKTLAGEPIIHLKPSIGEQEVEKVKLLTLEAFLQLAEGPKEKLRFGVLEVVTAVLEILQMGGSTDRASIRINLKKNKVGINSKDTKQYGIAVTLLKEMLKQKNVLVVPRLT